MQRVVIAATFGLVGGFRMHANRSDVDLAGDAVEEKAPQRALCSLSGDPHILSFDGSWKGGHQYHATQAPGHWWLVKTESGMVKVQATYGYCGGATCMSGVAVSGSFIGRSTLIIQAPCDWDQATRKCLNSDKTARITWKGARVQSVNEGGVVVTSANQNHVVAKLPGDMEIDVAFFHGSPPGFMHARIFMVQGSAGPQCGHCGNFDGDWKNDDVYQANGALKPTAQGACDAFVQCKERLIPGDTKCAGILPDLAKEECPQDVRDKAEKECRDKIAAAADPAISDKIPTNILEDELQDCIQDACVDQGFEGDDAKDDEELNEALIKMNR